LGAATAKTVTSLFTLPSMLGNVVIYIDSHHTHHPRHFEYN